MQELVGDLKGEQQVKRLRTTDVDTVLYSGV